MEGDSSRNLRVLRTSYKDRQIEMTVEGRPEQHYEVRAYTPLRLVATEGVRSIEDRGDYKAMELALPTDNRLVDKAGYMRWQVHVKTEPRPGAVQR